ncbi:hypothetical protein IBX73_10125 [candidate division WOR-3 bacterium]|nr:hypothetical protein [candidate division WOR-3 bacterium]
MSNRNRFYIFVAILLAGCYTIHYQLLQPTAAQTCYSKEVDLIAETRDNRESLKIGKDALGVALIAEKGGNFDYKGLTANQIIVKLENKEYATEITDVNAAEYANKGAVVIAGAKEAVGSGHVAVVAPTPLEQLGTSGAWGITKTGTVPKVFNVGRSVGLIYANYGFLRNDPPKYYIRNIDKMKVDEMNKELRNE